MPIFKIDNSKLKKISSKSVTEKELQKLIEDNLKETLGIDFLASEYTTSGGRIDTLGVDPDGSPVIIEYKKTENDNIINQGLSYLRWLKGQKKEFFEKLVENKLGQKREVLWDSPRVICLAGSFNKFDLDTVEILPINIELIRYKIYEDNLLLLEAENISKGVTKKSKKLDQVLQKEYKIEDHIGRVDKQVKEIFYQLREMILSLDENIQEKVKKVYIGYSLSNIFVEFSFRKSKLEVFIRTYGKKLDDPRGFLEDVPESFRFVFEKRFFISSLEQISDAMRLIKQAYLKTV